MKRVLWTILALGLVASPGCILTSGQIQIDFQLPNFKATSPTGLEHETIDLSTEPEYEDNKDKLKDLSDLAVLGKFINNGTGAVNVEVWATPDTTSYTSESALKADSKALKIWGPFVVAPSGTKVIDWNESAKLFTKLGKAMLLSEAKGDGMFTLYAIGGAGTYNFEVQNGVLVLVLDAGI